MRNALARTLLLLAAVAASATASAEEPQLPPAATHQVDFHREILPILANRCATCHASGRAEGGFSLETRAALLRESDSGQTVVLGKSGESLLIELVAGVDPGWVMPKQGKRLSEQEVGLLRAWIDQGAPWEKDVTLRKLSMQTWKPRPVELPAAGASQHPIDRLLAPYFEQHGIDASQVVDDRTFARRVYYDLVGLPPTPAELQTFLDDRRSDKRTQLVRTLLADDEGYADHWLSFWNDLLRNDYAGTGYIDGGRSQITAWLYQALYENKPLDEFVSELIQPAPGAEGFIKGIVWRGKVNASQRPPIQAAQNVAQVFLGINLKCASCHDSFISQWKLKDAYQFASVFTDQPLELYECDKATGEFAEPAFLNPEIGTLSADADRAMRQKELAALIVSSENARLRRTIVNRLWARFFGRGLIEPVDEIDNPAWHEDLLEWLAADMQAEGDDMRQVMERLVTSRAYQLPSAGEQLDDTKPFVFRGPLVRRLTAEQFVDTIWRATATAPKKPHARIDKTIGRLPGKWIWSHAKKKAPAEEKLALRFTFQVEGKVKETRCAITCDNRYTLWLNGEKLARDANRWTVESVPLHKALRQGKNELVVLAENVGETPSQAGFYFVAKILYENKPPLVLATDADWQTSATLPDASGTIADSAVWQAAVPLRKQDLLGGDVRNQLAYALGESRGTRRSIVRASLVIADPLMRSLGRPNRDQVVTSRPAELSTLQALDLSNGPHLAELLGRGAKNLLAAHADWTEDEAVAFVYENFVNRPPTPSEAELARQMVGSPVTQAGLADLMWAVLMLPEFQLIR